MRTPLPKYIPSFDTPTLLHSKSPAAVEPKPSCSLLYRSSSNIFNTSFPPGPVNGTRLRASDNNISGSKRMQKRLHFLNDNPTNHSNKGEIGIGRYELLSLRTKNLVHSAQENNDTVALSKTLTKLETRGRYLDDSLNDTGFRTRQKQNAQKKPRWLSPTQ